MSRQAVDDRGEVSVQTEGTVSSDIPAATAGNGIFDYDRSQNSWIIRESVRISEALPTLIISNASIAEIELINDLISDAEFGRTFANFLRANGAQRPSLVSNIYYDPDDSSWGPYYIEPGYYNSEHEFGYHDFASTSIHIDFRNFDAFVGGFVNSSVNDTIGGASDVNGLSIEVLFGWERVFRNEFQERPSILGVSYDEDPSRWADASTTLNGWVPIDSRQLLMFGVEDTTGLTTRIVNGISWTWVHYRAPNQEYWDLVGLAGPDAHMATNLIHELSGHGGLGGSANFSGHAAVFGGLLQPTHSDVSLFDEDGNFDTATVASLIRVNDDPVERYVYSEGLRLGFFQKIKRSWLILETVYSSQKQTQIMDSHISVRVLLLTLRSCRKLSLSKTELQ